MAGFWDTVGFTINVLFDLVGALFFGSMLIVIVKNKNLHRTTCHKLIAIFFVCCLGSKVIIVLPYLIRVVPLPNVQTWVCAAVDIIPFSMTMAVSSVTMVIAFDRLISVIFPVWYLHSRKTGYLFALCVVASFYATYMGVFLVKNTIENTFIQTNCTTVELYGGPQPEWTPAINFVTVACYIIMFVRFFFYGREKRKAYIRDNPVFKSLIVIIAIQLFSWIFITEGYQRAPWITSEMSPDQRQMFYYGLNCLASSSATIEVPAIYYTSSEYRKAFQQEFGWFLFPFGQQVAPSVVMFSNTNATR